MIAGWLKIQITGSYTLELNWLYLFINSNIYLFIFFIYIYIPAVEAHNFLTSSSSLLQAIQPDGINVSGSQVEEAKHSQPPLLTNSDIHSRQSA